MMSIMALLLFGVVLALGGVTPELVAPSFLLGLLLMVIWALRVFFRPGLDVPIKRSPMHLPALLFGLYALGRYWGGAIEYEGRIELFQLVLCGAVYFVCANQFRTPGHRRLLILLLAGLAVFEAMFGLWQALTKSDAVFHWLRPVQYRGRASGTYVCPNHLAGCLEMILGLLVARLAYVKAEAASFERSMLIKVGLFYAAIMSITGVVFSQSRAGWIAAAGSLAILVLWGRTLSGKALLRLTVLGLFLAVIAGLVARSEFGRRRLSETFKRDASTGELQLRDATAGGRLLMWTGTLKLISENPLFGTGPGTWQWLYPRHKEGKLQVNPEYAHNDYLNLISDYGLVGAGLVGWFFVAFFRHARVLGRVGGPPEQRAFAIGAAVAVSAILIHSAFDFNLHIPANAVLLAAIMGTLAGMDDSLNRYPAAPIGRRRFAVAGSALILAGVSAWQFFPTVLSAHFSDIGAGFHRRLEYDAAIYFYHKAIEADLRAPEPLVKLGETYLVQAAFRIGPEKEESRRELASMAIEAFDQALDLNPYLVSAWVGRGRGCELAGNDAQALVSYQKARGVDPVNASVFFRIGCYYRDHGDMTNAASAFARSDELRTYGDLGAAFNLLDISTRDSGR